MIEKGLIIVAYNIIHPYQQQLTYSYFLCLHSSAELWSVSPKDTVTRKHPEDQVLFKLQISSHKLNHWAMKDLTSADN